MKKNNGIKIFDGGVAIVTGGASGIGLSLGKTLAARGCEVVLADINDKQAEEAAAGIRDTGSKASSVKLDVSNLEAVQSVVRETFDRCGRLDYMFNNAGIAINGKFQEHETSDWDRCLNVNLKGVVHGVRAAFSVMEKQGFGHIVNTASLAGIFPWPTTIAYTAAKHAVVGISTAMRAEIAQTGIRVSVLCPGSVQTAIFEHGSKNGRWVGNFSDEKVAALFKGAKAMDSDKFAVKALKQVARNKPIILLPSEYKILWRINRLSPSLGISVSSMISKAVFKKVGS